MAETVTVESWEAGTSKNGNAYYKVKQAQGPILWVYDTKDQSYIAQHGPGVYSCDLSQNGNFHNAKGFQVAATAAIANATPAPGYVAGDADQLLRSEALRIAQEGILSGKFPIPQGMPTSQAIIALADVYFDYIRDHKRPPRPAARTAPPRETAAPPPAASPTGQVTNPATTARDPELAF